MLVVLPIHGEVARSAGGAGVLTGRGSFPSPGRGRPERLQVVVRALARQEHVREHRIEIEQDPARVGVAVDRERSFVLRFRSLDHSVGYSPHLAVGLALADDEVIGDRRLIADVDHDRIPCLLLGCGALEQTRELERSESPGPVSSQPTDYPHRGGSWRCTRGQPAAPPPPPPPPLPPPPPPPSPPI